VCPAFVVLCRPHPRAHLIVQVLVRARPEGGQRGRGAYLFGRTRLGHLRSQRRKTEELLTPAEGGRGLLSDGSRRPLWVKSIGLAFVMLLVDYPVRSTSWHIFHPQNRPSVEPCLETSEGMPQIVVTESARMANSAANQRRRVQFVAPGVVEAAADADVKPSSAGGATDSPARHSQHEAGVHPAWASPNTGSPSKEALSSSD